MLRDIQILAVVDVTVLILLIKPARIWPISRTLVQAYMAPTASIADSNRMLVSQVDMSVPLRIETI